MQPRGEDTIDELAQVAWTRIEQTLYKFTPGRAKAFGFWNQITYLSSLAYIKKYTRDACALRRWNNDAASLPPRVSPVVDEEEPRPSSYKVMEELREAVKDNPMRQEMMESGGLLPERGEALDRLPEGAGATVREGGGEGAGLQLGCL